MRLKDKTAIVSGAGQTPGTTIGNGRAMAILFAREGADVLCVDRDGARAQETVDMILKEGGRAAALEANIAKSGAGDTIVAHFDSIPAKDTVSKPRIRLLVATAAKGNFATSLQHLPPNQRVSYKFVSNGSTWSRDPAAHWVEWDGIDTGTVGDFNSVTFDSALAPLSRTNGAPGFSDAASVWRNARVPSRSQ